MRKPLTDTGWVLRLREGTKPSNQRPCSLSMLWCNGNGAWLKAHCKQDNISDRALYKNVQTDRKIFVCDIVLEKHKT